MGSKAVCPMSPFPGLPCGSREGGFKRDVRRQDEQSGFSLSPLLARLEHKEGQNMRASHRGARAIPHPTTAQLLATHRKIARASGNGESRTTAVPPTTLSYLYPDRIHLADFSATSTASLREALRSPIPDLALGGENVRNDTEER